jgi:oligopeptide/dipeptide ABC transporter ATP-binding protein
VLYRGSVAEAGDVECVVKRPQHPYTQLLISSIPMASAERTWSSENGSAPAIHATGTTGCRFADRCPSVTPPCLQTPPPLFQTEPHRAVACYLYQSAPTLASGEMVRVFTGLASTVPMGVPGPLAASSKE